MLIEEAKQLLRLGYQSVETGFHRLQNGQICISVLTAMPGCMPHWVDWWFGTYLKDSKLFKEWDPETHLSFRWDKKWKPGQYIGASYNAEYLLGGKVYSFKFLYIDPIRYFDISKFAEANIGAAICGEVFLPDGTLAETIIHLVRKVGDGCEMRTRIWLNEATDDFAILRMQHCILELCMLGNILRMMRREESNTTSRLNVRCKYCRSKHVVKNGKHKSIQNWLCIDCGRTFVNPQAWPRMKYPIRTVANAVNNYYSGVSKSLICKLVEEETGFLPSTSSVHQWIKKLTQIALTVVQKYQPCASSNWVIDEMLIQFKDKTWWVYYVIDTASHFILATKISHSRDIMDIKSMLVSASEKAGMTPFEIFTKNYNEYFEAVKLAFPTYIPKVFPLNNQWKNVILSWHDILADSLRLDYGKDVYRNTQALLQGFVLHYNYIRINEYSGSIPAQAAMIEYPFRSWLELIKGNSPSVSR